MAAALVAFSPATTWGFASGLPKQPAANATASASASQENSPNAPLWSSVSEGSSSVAWSTTTAPPRIEVPRRETREANVPEARRLVLAAVSDVENEKAEA